MIAVKHAFLAAKQKFLLKQKEKILKSNDAEALEMVDKELTAVTEQLDKLREREAKLVEASRLALSGNWDALKDVPMPDKILDKRREWVKGVNNLRHKNNPFAMEYALLTLPLAIVREFIKEQKEIKKRTEEIKKEKKKYKEQRDSLQPLFDVIDNAVDIKTGNDNEFNISVNGKQLLLVFRNNKTIWVSTSLKDFSVDVPSEKLTREIIHNLHQKMDDLQKQSKANAIGRLKEYTK